MDKFEEVAPVGLISAPEYKHRSCYPIYQIWGGMTGKIWVLHTTWNKNRVRKEIIDTKSSVGQRLKELDIEVKQANDVIDTIARYGNFTTEGDLIALDHIMSLLRFLYSPDDINIRNSWCFGQGPEDVLEHEDFKNIMKDNIILLCGPIGNLATGIFLEQMGLSWIFDGHSIRVHPEKEPFEPEGNISKEDFKVDYGVFLRSQNPFNPEKKIYGIMGAYAFGTQGAAAFGCSEESCAELIRGSQSIDVTHLANVDYIGWVKVWKYPVMKDFGDRHIKYQLIYPEPPTGIANWEIHKNPSLIYQTQTTLKTALLENTLFLGARPSKLLLYSFTLVVVVFLTCMLVWTKINNAIVIGIVLLAAIFTAKLFISLLLPPMRRK